MAKRTYKVQFYDEYGNKESNIFSLKIFYLLLDLVISIENTLEIFAK